MFIYKSPKMSQKMLSSYVKNKTIQLNDCYLILSSKYNGFAQYFQMYKIPPVIPLNLIFFKYVKWSLILLLNAYKYCRSRGSRQYSGGRAEA